MMMRQGEEIEDLHFLESESLKKELLRSEKECRLLLKQNVLYEGMCVV